MEYYKILDENKIQCLLCSHYCILKKEQTGICGVNKNRNNELINLVYGYPIAIHIDPIEKKPLYHFFPGSEALSIGTNGCNFKCPFCQNWHISQNTPPSPQYDQFISPEKIVNIALKYKTRSIAYTYNEPSIFYPYIKDIALISRKYNIKNIMVSNGFMSKEVINDMKGLIDALNIDLKSFNKEYYRKELKGNLQTVLDNLKILVKEGFWVEITTLIIPTINDTEQELKKIAKFISEELSPYIPWHISAFHPDYKLTALPLTSSEMLEKAYIIGKQAGLKYIYKGNIGIKYKIDKNNCKHGVFK